MIPFEFRAVSAEAMRQLHLRCLLLLLAHSGHPN
jgi:hypothetical protein